mmetsp:Transcript_7771/g.19256  ORF Transcript_7771/g.19256 Transcript_7771/m.19256 type:complete len:279 (+) Transcript_7771:58-894(+)
MRQDIDAYKTHPDGHAKTRVSRMVALPHYALVLLALAERRSAPQAAGELRLRAGPLRLAERVALAQYAQVLLVLGALERALALKWRRRRLLVEDVGHALARRDEHDGVGDQLGLEARVGGLEPACDAARGRPHVQQLLAEARVVARLRREEHAAQLLAEQRLRLLRPEAEAARGRVHGARHAHSELDPGERDAHVGDRAVRREVAQLHLRLVQDRAEGAAQQLHRHGLGVARAASGVLVGPHAVRVLGEAGRHRRAEAQVVQASELGPATARREGTRE